MVSVNLNGFSAELSRDKDLFGKMDPYFIIYKNRQQVFQSSVQKSAGKSPSWPDQTSFDVYEGDEIEIKIFDKDLLRDSNLGSATFPASELLRFGFRNVPLVSRKNSGTLSFTSMPSGAVQTPSIYQQSSNMNSYPTYPVLSNHVTMNSVPIITRYQETRTTTTTSLVR